MKDKLEIGDHIRLKKDIRDAYMEVYLSEGDIVTITQVYPAQVGYEYQIPYGFCIGKEDFEYIPRNTLGPYGWVKPIVLTDEDDVI